MWKTVTFVTLFLTLALYVAIAFMDRELSRQTGYSSVSFQMVSDRTVAGRILDSMGTQQRFLAETALAVDFAFMFLGYGLLFFSLSRLLDSSILSFFSFLPVVFDSAENIMHLSALVNDQPEMLTASCLISVLKFLLLAVYLLLLAITAVLRVLRKRNARS